jgi:hypothetical protein
MLAGKGQDEYLEPVIAKIDQDIVECQKRVMTVEDYKQ